MRRTRAVRAFQLLDGRWLGVVSEFQATGVTALKASVLSEWQAEPPGTAGAMKIDKDTIDKVPGGLGEKLGGLLK